MAEHKRETENDGSQRDKGSQCILSIEDEQTNENYDNKCAGKQYGVQFGYRRADILVRVYLDVPKVKSD
jgi:hypothetical protein